jgi:uncharacterized protein YjbJ (UPF0337 family)
MLEFEEINTMTQEEAEGKWDPGSERVHLKWGSLTRAERTEFSGRRQKRNLELHELYGISEEEAEQTIAEERNTLKAVPVLPRA